MHATDHVASPGDDWRPCSCDDDEDLHDAQHALHVAEQRLQRIVKGEQAKARAAREANLRVQRLPAELLLLVARIVAIDNPRSVTRLAAVCTSFRDVEDPATRGPDDAERELATVLERLSEARDLLARTRPHPVPNEWPPVLEATLQELIAFKARTTASTDWELSFGNCLQLIFGQSARLLRFEFRSTRRKPTEIVADYIRNAETPILRELVLHLDPSCRFAPLAPRHAPMLVSADLQGVLSDPVPLFTGLRNLSLVNGTFNAPPTALAPLLALLRANPEIEDLRLQPLIPHTFPASSVGRINSPTSLVSLPRLSRLHLIHNSRLDRFLLQLRLPALTHLTLAIQTGAPGPLLSPIFQGIPYPELNTLRLVNLFIRAPAHERDLTATLKQLGTLRTLAISESSLCESMLQALADPECCPLLEELLFERCEGITQDAVLDIWRARGAANGAPNSGMGRGPRRTRGSGSQTAHDGDVRMAERGTLRSLIVRESSTPLADMQLGECIRS
ncbi:F-box-like protein [Ceratobasidium sp. AG-Ba]|nr:F-box-like protein [Ceratobasidium sp. AG-Ba]QRW02027.1 F-box-like domain protein [Ceratobasidium sp. AG-Ba]